MKEKKLYLIILAIIIILALIIGFAFAKYVTVVEQEITVVLKDAKIKDNEIILEPDYWTNNNVKLTVQTDKVGDVYYKKNEDGEWIKYEGELNIEENCDIYVKLVYEDGEGPETIKKITKISKPTEEVARVTTDKFSVIFDSVQAAIDAAETDDAVVTLLKDEINESVTIAENQKITLDVNGKTLTGTETSTITNNGTLTISGASGTITCSGADTIKNVGSLVKDTETKIENTSTENYFAINNSGAVSISSGTIESSGRGIGNYDDGKVAISGGTLTTVSGTITNYGEAKSESSPAIKITGDPVLISTSSNVISNNSGATGLIYINGGTLNQPTLNATTPTIINAGNGKIIIEEGTIKCSGTHTVVLNGYNSGNANGTVEIRGGTIESDTAIGVKNCEKGNVIISGGSICGTRGIESTSAEKIEVNGGTITSTTYAGVAVYGGTLTVGTNESTPNVSITEPSITGKTYGVYVNESGTFNFYDGVIKGAEGKSISSTPTKTPDGYVVNKTIDGTVETALLGPSAPVVTAKLNNSSGAEHTSGKWTNQNVYVTLSSNNVGAGIKEYQWYENGAWTTRAITTSNNVGTITYTAARDEDIRFRAIDNNGVISAESTFTVRIDKTKPTAIINTESMYVTDGLVTRLDGVNNNSGTHSSNVTTWKDISSNGKNGTIINGTWGANYLDFNGTSSWVNLGVMNSNYQTLEATFSPDATESLMIIGNWEAGGGGIYINDSGYIYGKYYIGGSYRGISSKVKVVAGNKYHVAITYDGSTVILYVNGVEQGRVSVSGTIGVPFNSTVMALGTDPAGASARDGYFDGKIYNAAVYNKALTAEQVKTNANAGKALAGGPTNAEKITYTIRFDETVEGFTTADITVTNGAKGSFTEVTAGKVYNIEVATSANQNNTQTIKLNANGCTDVAGNGIAENSKTVVIDRVAPTATINTESMYVTDGLVTRLDGVNNNGGTHSSNVTTWKDISSNGKNGTIANGTWGENYLEFNGTSSWVNLGVMNSNYQTLEATFSPDATEILMIIGNWEAGGGGIYINGSGYIYGEYYIGGSYRGISSKVKVVAGNKYHVAITYDGSTVILYVNGVEQGRVSVSGTIGVPFNSTVMALGTNPAGASARDGYFDGKIYNAAVYNKALTAEQVKTNANAGKALAGGPTNAEKITYTIRFDKIVEGFTTDDITVTNGTKGSFAEVTSGKEYKVEATTSANQNNTQTIKLIANGCIDIEGNGIAETSKTVVIDRVAPTVTLSANGGTYNIAPGSSNISISTVLTANDTGSGIAGYGYAWSTSNTTEPTTWTEFTSQIAITGSRSGGNSYIWTNVIDNAGNRATTVKVSNAFTVRYQVVFNANNGSGAPGTQYKVHGTNLTLSSTKPTRTGYTFKEWNTKADGTGTSYASGASYTANSAVTLYAQWDDKTAPVIVSATASSTSDIASYVDFNATDGGSGIKYYNISTSTTAPTTWIPVVSAVETNTETKYENNAAWARVFHHNSHWGNVLFSSANSGAEAKSSNTVDKYSVLGNIANYKNSSNWEFMLQYPDVSGTGYNRWTQTSNPVTSNNTISGYAAVGTPTWTWDAWGGLALSSRTSNTLIDGSPGNSTWFYAIGAYNKWNGGIPGPNDMAVGTVNLWSRIDNLSATTSANLTRRLGDLKANTTYYIWVKDSAGNTASKAVTVSNVDATKPTATITSTNNVAASQTATLTLSDNVGLDKYYWGTTNPANSNVTYTAIDGSPKSKTITQTVSANGTYYLAVLDKAGNRTIVNKVFYKTTLTPNRGSVSPTSIITMAGNKFTIPTPSAVTGYTFNGWYKEAALTNSAGTSYTPTGNTTLYGKWTVNNYTITYDYNYMDNDIYGTKPLTTNFSSALAAVGTTSRVNNDSAKYGKEMRYTITTAGTGGAHLSPGRLTVGKTYTWSVYVKASKNVTLLLGQEQNGRKQVNVTTSWQRFTYTFTAGDNQYNSFVFYSQGTGWAVGDVMYMHSLELKETPKLNITTQSKTYNTELGTLPTASRAGYTFQGWYTAPVGGTKISTTTKVPAANTTYYARWTVNTYKMTLNNQSATSAGSTEFYVKYSNGYYKESTCQTTITSITVPTKTNWIFQGYYTAANGGGTQIIDSSGKITSNMTNTKFTANTTLYAYWITNYQNTTLGKYYLYLGQALAEVNSSSTATHTIKALRSFTDTGGRGSVSSGKTVNLEVGANTVEYAGYGCITNAGTLNVNGTGALISFNSTSNSQNAIGSTIRNNKGTLNLKGGIKIENTSTSNLAAAITNENAGTINVTNATIVGDQVGIHTYNNSSGSGSKIVIASGSTVTGTNIAGLYGGESVTVNGNVTGTNRKWNRNNKWKWIYFNYWNR